MSITDFFVTCPTGVESLLDDELRNLGALNCRVANGGVAFQGDLETAYRICLWSRTGSRVLMPLKSFEANDADAIYAAGRVIEWPDLFDAYQKFSINVAGQAPGISNSHFAALRLKDAVVDSFRKRKLPRPVIDTQQPNVRLHLHLNRGVTQISLDLSGESLHRRGYRINGVEAPLKENLACAVLARCHWKAHSQGALELAGARSVDPIPLPGVLYDPMCGSGTFLIEGAWIAADVAPAILRTRWGFEAWTGHKPDLWQKLVGEAHRRRDVGLSRLKTTFFGIDQDPRAIAVARENVVRAGLSEHVRIEIGDALVTRPGIREDGGFIMCNPPYGERMATETELIKLYSMFGATLKAHYGGWKLGFFTSRPDLATRLGLRAFRIQSFYNGAIPCKLLQFEIPASGAHMPNQLATDFQNRLIKNKRHFGRWARKHGVSCYRVYDVDLPDYAVTIDLYVLENRELHVCVQEHQAPKSVDAVMAEKRLRRALATIRETFEVAPAQIHYKLRKKQKGAQQYRKQGSAARLHVIREHGCRLQLNFEDYIDTGLFLDHRPIRRRLQNESAGARVLNLFSYTGAATVHAAIGGAISTVSVDLSKTYLEWTRQNLELNGHLAAYRTLRTGSPTHRTAVPGHCLVQADCRTWLQQQSHRTPSPQFDLIFLDPPTFSNSKKTPGELDLQRDHSALLQLAMALLAREGVLYFSTNRRNFKLDAAALSAYQVSDITSETLDNDFKRLRPPHRCWSLRHSLSQPSSQKKH